ncbi:lysophospholipid acyltransferase family protein [Hymenobacter profundi]|uniref:lysophospholipid acyltransferase family protein n=1 Tax=Hymenobacter profundi TaxID=1982110 RepID=UPI001FE98EBF|nr:lysophospholipid acyltransferase family protein [Hymenobacter profundi]
MPPSTPAKPYPWYLRPVNWLLIGLSRLPLSVLYFLSDGIYLLLAYGVRYRWRVITENIRNSFPEKTEVEVAATGRAFYRHFAQVMVEILKLRTISAKELGRRVRFTNPELIEPLFEAGRTVLTLGSHAGNWEWILSGAAVRFPGRADGVYKPLSSPFFESFMYELRTRTGAVLVPMRNTLRHLLSTRGEGRALSLLTDQAAGPRDSPYWTTFLHQDTSFYTSADRLAPQLQAPVFYVSIQRARRGYYDITITLLYDGYAPIEKGSYPIAEDFARLLERDIQAAPAQYLWSHRRWKHKRNVE